MTFILIGSFVCAAALVMLVVAERDYRAHKRWCASAATAQGTVARIGRRNWHSRNEPGSDDNVRAVPVVRFRAADGVEYEFDAEELPPQAGVAVEVAYDPALPSAARVRARGRRFGCALIVLAIGVVMINWGALR